MTETAIYQSTGVPSFVVGNPLAEALPLMPSEAELVKKLLRAPKGNFNPASGTAAFELSTLHRINVPRLESPLAAFRIQSMLYNTYARCNPLNVETLQRINAIDEKTMVSAIAQGLQVEAMTVLAWSGMGKTTMIRTLLDLYPPTILHQEYRGEKFFLTQVVYLSVDAPVGASPKGLLLNIAAALDDALGLKGERSYVHQLLIRKLSIEGQRVLLARALSTHCVGLLHIDDMQRVAEGPKTLRDATASTIISMANTIGCAILFSGTPAALPVLQANFEISRRATRRGAVSIHAPVDASDRFFEGLSTYLFKFQVLKEPVVLTPILIKILLNLTAGIPGVLISLYVAAQEAALFSKLPLDAKLFKRVMKDQFWIIVPAIRRLNQARQRGRLDWDPDADDVIRRFLDGKHEGDAEQ